MWGSSSSWITSTICCTFSLLFLAAAGSTRQMGSRSKLVSFFSTCKVSWSRSRTRLGLLLDQLGSGVSQLDNEGLGDLLHPLAQLGAGSRGVGVEEAGE